MHNSLLNASLAHSGNPCCAALDYVPAAAALLPQLAAIDDVSCHALRAHLTAAPAPAPAPAPVPLADSSAVASAPPPPVPENTVVTALLQVSVAAPLHDASNPPPRSPRQRLQAAERAAAAAAFQENLAVARADTSRDRMQQAESQLQLRVQELESLRESLAEVQAAAAAVTSDRDALRQALSNQDKAMHAMKAYIGTIAATAATAAPSPPAPPPAVEQHVDPSAGRGNQQVLEALEAQLKAAKQARGVNLSHRRFAIDCGGRCCWSRTALATTSRRRRTSWLGGGGQRYSAAA